MQSYNLLGKPIAINHNTVVVWLLSLLLLIGTNSDSEAAALTTSRKERSNLDSSSNCTQLQPDILIRVLGSAFNKRYMSIELPPDIGESEFSTISTTSDGQRSLRSPAPNERPAFAVNGDEFIAQQSADISDEPAWSRIFFDDRALRIRRQTSSTAAAGAANVDRFGRQPQMPWSCRAQIQWLDLGDEYFPRFLRSISCTKQKCWYGYFTCRPRSFLVRILRRRKGECVRTKTSQSSSVDDGYLPDDLRELWTWEEWPVNFCCDCAMK